MRTIPLTQESTRYLRMHFNANMTNDESVHAPADEDRPIWMSRVGASLGLAPPLLACADEVIE
jgi:hypothetical protein